MNDEPFKDALSQYLNDAIDAGIYSSFQVPSAVAGGGGVLGSSVTSGAASMGNQFGAYTRNKPRPRPMEVKSRTPMFNIQIIRRVVPDGSTKAFIAIGLDGAESYQLGPYDADITLADALALVSTDLRLDDKFSIGKQFTDRTA